MQMTVTIIEVQCPHPGVVTAQQTFTDTAAALAFINTQAADWCQRNEGHRCEPDHNSGTDYAPIGPDYVENGAYFRLWGGESVFQACFDAASYAALTAERYKRMGFIPGYMVNSMLDDGGSPGSAPLTETERAELTQQRDVNLASLEACGKPLN